MTSGVEGSFQAHSSMWLNYMQRVWLRAGCRKCGSGDSSLLAFLTLAVCFPPARTATYIHTYIHTYLHTYSIPPRLFLQRTSSHLPLLSPPSPSSPPPFHPPVISSSALPVFPSPPARTLLTCCVSHADLFFSLLVTVFFFPSLSPTHTTRNKRNCFSL